MEHPVVQAAAAPISYCLFSRGIERSRLASQELALAPLTRTCYGHAAKSVLGGQEGQQRASKARGWMLALLPVWIFTELRTF